MSKHEEILTYIEGLEIGNQVSVRRIANRMKVADGTAYRAIKEAENRGLVAINDRSGTVRVASNGRKPVYKLTFAKVAEITNAEILGGLAGINVEFDHFIISAMQKESVKKYLEPNGLVIVGDRSDIQNLALNEHNAVLVTGGFEVEDSVIAYANQMGIPLMRSNFDTFTVASRISYALSNELIKKDIITVSQVIHHNVPVLQEENTVKDFLDLMKKTNLSRFAVTNRHHVVVGIITMRDVNHKNNSTQLNKLMSQAIVAKLDMTVASVSQRMIYEGYSTMPVVNDNHTYAGLITRADILKSLQKSQEENQILHTFSEDMASKISKQETFYTLTVEPFMINNMGNISYGALSEVISILAQRIMTRHHRNIIIESMNMNFMNTVAIDHVLEIYPKIISETRIGAMVDIEIYHVNHIIAKVLVNLQIT